MYGTSYYECDQAWENRAYVHIKFGHVLELKFHNFVSNLSLSMKHLQLLEDTMGNLIQFTEHRRWDKWPEQSEGA